MVPTAYKGRKTNIMNFLGRRIHFRLIFRNTSARSVVCLQVNQEYLYADLLRCQKGLLFHSRFTTGFWRIKVFADAIFFSYCTKPNVHNIRAYTSVASIKADEI